MRCRALLPMLLALPVWASESDMQSVACHDALAALQAHESAMAAAASAPSPTPDRPAAATADRTWRALRAQAAHVCLGGEPDAPPPPPRAPVTPPIPVPRVAAVPPLAPPATHAAPPPLPARPLPPVITSCDTIGCWTSDGERLPQYGRSPFDPRVHCTVQGRIVMCL
ncbi:MAG TPA: hypothetical protein VFK10_08980 [Burkholderiaceae bacterium]|nr:hypothetical protein [Burkholderiaceae bacterium]